VHVPDILQAPDAVPRTWLTTRETLSDYLQRITDEEEGQRILGTE
jgi:hypothetical protein